MSGDLEVAGEGALLAAAALVLRAHGFVLRTVNLEGVSAQMLLAEDELFLLGAVEFASADHLVAVEGAAAVELADQLGDVGAKRWDAYLVLMTESPAADQSLWPSVTDILYNTRYLRRLIRWELSPSQADLTVALRTFLPLPELLQGGGSALDPSRRMIDRMIAYGAPRDQAAEAYELWRAMGEEDVDVES